MNRLVIRTVMLALSLVVTSTALAQGAQRVKSVNVSHLPLKELPANGAGDVFAVFLTGDGGWTTLERETSIELHSAGIPVVGFSQLRYLLRRRSPERVGADLGRIIAFYSAKWQRPSVVVIGYSRGAGIVPFAVNRLPPAQRAAVRAMVLLGAEHTAGFKLGVRELFTNKPRADELPVMPELTNFRGATLICVYGEREGDTLCPELAPPAVVIKLTGDHHFDHRYREIGRRIAELVTPGHGP